MMRYNIFIKAIWEQLSETYSENKEILMVTYRSLLSKMTNFLKSGGYKNVLI